MPAGSSGLMTAMGDALRPSDGEFRRVLHESFRRWSSYFDEADESVLSHHCVNLKNLLGPTPSSSLMAMCPTTANCHLHVR